MVARAVFTLAIALISVALADQAQLEHTERLQACLAASIRIQSPAARQAYIDECANICPRPCGPGYVCHKGACMDPSHICPYGCGPGYFCQRGVCVDSCLTIKCKSGYRCYRGQCRKVMGCGEQCDYPKWICAVGASCINNKCTGPTVGENGTCGGSSCNRCKAGTRCYHGKCRKVMGCGQSCDYPKWICGAGATCKHGRCHCGHHDAPVLCQSANDCPITDPGQEPSF